MPSPELATALPGLTCFSKESIRVFRRPAPGIGILQCPGVFLPDHPRVVSADLAGDDVRDVSAPTTRAGDGVDEGECLLRQGDVRSDERHRVTPSVIVLHTS
jgi:hypothetical protein